MDKSLILNEIKSYYNIKSDTDFAHFLGVKPQTLSNWKARNSMDYDLIYTRCVEIDANWLLTGKGEMLKRKQNEESTDTPTIIDIAIGDRIKDLRLSKDLKQKDIAEILEMDPSQYSKIESSKLMPTLLQVMQISKILNESIDYIVSGRKSEKEPSVYQEINVALKDQIELLKENKKLLENEINTLKSSRSENKTYRPYTSESKSELEK
ncbi:hypothetical protein ATE49_04950 [Elizabethkingia miricola]|uniref:Transcriptional regulator with XRE-family HTH domain n=1 Tax=Elizabethkingia miricola TaxID=172045 RepID=A0ABY3NG26_ELIMR|nr:helix-turn-helix transcriptional regulator [Elizabethkingia miricola]OBS12572.1 hypothetical protein ATE49_04950 [Elizabethkingia miricola]TYO91947.1 transcriptional regulator with XRE-family HTH domain [Elizabethkingia miricola]